VFTFVFIVVIIIVAGISFSPKNFIKKFFGAVKLSQEAFKDYFKSKID